MKNSLYLLMILPFVGACVRNSSYSVGRSNLASFSVRVPVKVGERFVSKFALSYQKEGGERLEQVFVPDNQKPGEIINEKLKADTGKYVFSVKAFDGENVVAASDFCKDEQKQTVVEIKEGDNDVVVYMCEADVPGVKPVDSGAPVPPAVDTPAK